MRVGVEHQPRSEGAPIEDEFQVTKLEPVVPAEHRPTRRADRPKQQLKRLEATARAGALPPYFKVLAQLSPLAFHHLIRAGSAEGILIDDLRYIQCAECVGR